MPACANEGAQHRNRAEAEKKFVLVLVQSNVVAEISHISQHGIRHDVRKPTNLVSGRTRISFVLYLMCASLLEGSYFELVTVLTT